MSLALLCLALPCLAFDPHSGTPIGMAKPSPTLFEYRSSFLFFARYLRSACEQKGLCVP